MESKIVGIVALYNPIETDMCNIEKYVDLLDFCILMDDSGCQNNSVCSKLLQNYRDKVTYICNDCNMGLCASVNKGFKIASELGADWILVMNPDGTFQNDAIKIFRKYIDTYDCDKVAILAPRFNFDRHQRQSKVGYTKIKYADMTGCLYNAKILKKLGYYDEKMYFDGLDTEYCIRVIKNKYNIIECSEAVLNHHPAHTKTLKIGSKVLFKYGIDSPVRYYYQFRSGYFIHKHYKNLRQDFFMLYKYLKIIFLFDNKREYKTLIRQGIIDAKKGYYGKYQERDFQID